MDRQVGWVPIGEVIDKVERAAVAEAEVRHQQALQAERMLIALVPKRPPVKRPKTPRATQIARNAEIVSAIASGEPFVTVAERYGVSSSRVSQIVSEARLASGVPEGAN